MHLGPLPSPPQSEASGSVPRLPVAVLVQMLEEDARARGTRLEISRNTPLLLARGDAAALAGARSVIGDLERAAAAFDIELEVALAPVLPARTAADDGARSAAGVLYRRRVGAGEETFFGARDTQSFVASFDVEVATDSGVADPIVGTISTGRTLHVRAQRIDGGRRVHLSGLLDLAEITDIERFDPQTSDLGVLQQPRVASAQAVFAGVVDSGQALELSLSGTGLSQPDWTLRIQATSQPDPEPPESETTGWSAFDLAFLSRDPPALPALRPRAGSTDAPNVRERSASALGPYASAIAAALDASRPNVSGVSGGSAGNAGRSSARAPVHLANDLLLVPRSEPALWREARALVRGSESLRSKSGRLEVRMDTLRASLPVCEGFPARLAIGEERARLVDYKVELAPQTWMPVPEVAVFYDGLALEAEPYAGFAVCSFFVSASRDAPEIARDEAQLGRLQLVSRSLHADAARIGANQPERTVLDLPAAPGTGDSAPGLHLRFQVP